METFDICRAWNGTSIKLDKSRSYHPTTPLTNDQQAEYIAKAKGQDMEVLAELKINRGTPRQVYARLNEKGIPVLLTSVRRSINTLFNAGQVKRVAWERNELRHREAVWQHVDHAH